MTARAASRFRPGRRVRVRAGVPPGHFRTPVYIQGKTGRVEAVHGGYRNPESLAYGGEGVPRRTLYRVVFLQRDVWGDRYSGPPGDTICLDVYEHWLETA